MRRRVQGLLIALATSIAATPEVLQSPRFDPFAPPSPAELRRAPAEAGAVGAGEWWPVLRGVLVAGDDSLVNLGGVVLALGEETRGWRLVEVHTRGAVFERGDERLELALDPGSVP